jgi:hypothetical protein
MSSDSRTIIQAVRRRLTKKKAEKYASPLLVVPQKSGKPYARRPDGGKEKPQGGACYEPSEGNMARASNLVDVTTKQRRIVLSRSEVVTEEPYAVIPHVRVCGSPGWKASQGHPIMANTE